MTFLFEDIYSGDFRFVNASDLSEAIEKFDSFESSCDSSDLFDSRSSSDFGALHVYVRIF